MSHPPRHRGSLATYYTRRGLLSLLLLSLANIIGCSSISAHLASEQAQQDAVEAARQEARSESVSWPATPRARKAVSLDRLASDNLVAVLAQVLPPMSTTIQTRAHTDPLGQLLVTRLVAAGYGIQRVDTDLGAHLLHYERNAVDAGETPGSGISRLNYSLSIGDVEVSRRYRLDATGRSVPDSPVRLAGSRLPVEVDDSGFADAMPGRATSSSLTRVSHVSQSTAPVEVPMISLITAGVVRNVARSTSQGPSLQALNTSQVEVGNRFYGNTMNFGGIARSHVGISRQVVIFPNDSMRLGEQGKSVIRQLVDQYQERTDLISLVGCSNGYTALAIGNEGLALGRSGRVTEELMSLGISRDHILDEGCWAPTSAGDRFPSRGVVIELLRRNRV